MSRRQRLLILLVTFGVLIALFSAVPAFAASRTAPRVSPPPFNITPITGTVVQIASPQAYQAANPNATFFTDTDTLPYLSSVRWYYVVTGVFQLTQKPGTQTAGVELAINPEAHSQLFAIGAPTPAFLAQHARDDAQMDSSSGSSSTVGSSMSSSSGLSALATLPRSPSTSRTTHFMDSYWHDPINITLTEVRDEIAFSYDGNNASNGYHRWFLNWAPDGWYDNNESHGSQYENSNGHTWIFSWTHVDFHNQVFCPLESTDTYYHSNTISVYWDGSFSSSVNSWSSGGCVELMHLAFYDG